MDKMCRTVPSVSGSKGVHNSVAPAVGPVHCGAGEFMVQHAGAVGAGLMASIAQSTKTGPGKPGPSGPVEQVVLPSVAPSVTGAKGFKDSVALAKDALVAVRAVGISGVDVGKLPAGLVAAPATSLSCPDQGLESSSVGWKVVGKKKGKWKK